MLFASQELARRIELAEVALLQDCAASTARRRGADKVAVMPIAGGLATFAGSSSPLNKVAGLGFDGAVTDAEMEEVERVFHAGECPVQVEVSCLADTSVGRLLTARGYMLEGFENVLGLPLPMAVPRPHDRQIEITLDDDDGFSEWLDVVVTGFAAPDTRGIESHESYPREAMEEAIRDVAGAAGFSRLTARRDGAPAGGGSMRMRDGIVQLCGAATAPEHRRQGVQTALLAERLRLAGESGCELALVTTLPGSKSQENVQRWGFELLYTRAILVLAP